MNTLHRENKGNENRVIFQVAQLQHSIGGISQVTSIKECIAKSYPLEWVFVRHSALPTRKHPFQHGFALFRCGKHMQADSKGLILCHLPYSSLFQRNGGSKKQQHTIWYVRGKKPSIQVCDSNRTQNFKCKYEFWKLYLYHGGKRGREQVFSQRVTHCDESIAANHVGKVGCGHFFSFFGRGGWGRGALSISSAS